jgi:hypothetical protein
MTADGKLERPAPGSTWGGWAAANVAGYFALLARRPRHARKAAWLAPPRFAGGGAVVLAAVAASMVAFDAWTIELVVRGLPDWLVVSLYRATDFG